MQSTNFSDWFSAFTGHPAPREWQTTLANEQQCRDQLIRIPTGLGKTEGVLSTWSYHRLCLQQPDWPRRLIWCLPMRVLVEQTAKTAKQLAEFIPDSVRPSVYIAMGGEDTGEWFLHPERPAIIIGTQDMLLSRALNRGYASSRARWPMEYGLINHDALWIMDEVQLMDVGLATSAQLQAFREEDAAINLRPCHTWWMSATLQSDWLRTVDTAVCHEQWVRNPCEVKPAQRGGGLWDIQKSLATATYDVKDHSGFAKQILAEHAKLPVGDYGRITLVVCNTVERACGTYDSLRSAGRIDGLELVHSRFRPAERENWQGRFLSREACNSGVDRIIVATQVVEAGVDISSGCLITELAPWPSLVQRMGRCARYGGAGHVLVVDRGRGEKEAPPYDAKELESAWDATSQLSQQGVGIAALESFEASLSPEMRKQLYPYTPSHLLLRSEFDELFDTTPDLTGADLDISRFIRTGDERDLQVFWLDIVKDDKAPSPKRQPQRIELCSVPFLKAREWLCGEETKTNRKPKLRSSMRAWVWDWFEGEWVVADRASLLPGRIICVAASCGGYRLERGFDAEWTQPVTVIPPADEPREQKSVNATENQQDGEQLSFNPWKTIAFHTQEVMQETVVISQNLNLSTELQDTLELAALWHDWGKAHPAFQGSIRAGKKIKRLNRVDLAKAPDECWPKKHLYHYLDDSERRPAFRHELASALGLFALLQTYQPQHAALLGPWREVFSQLRYELPSGELPLPLLPMIERLLKCSAEKFDLLVYLIASHHGKVRVGLHAAPKDQDYRDDDGRGLPIRGVREGDSLPPVALLPNEPPLPEVRLTLSPAALGLSERTGMSWRERCLGVIHRYGPTGLAFLESILRAADVRASRLQSNDPLLTTEASE